ncbi:MAG TPA: molybdopterin-dependent oxidoreductase [Bacteroidales bacterium]|nr:molybdopterin-dependent oxidoreductase [Bacteroidales bacterium]
MKKQGLSEKALISFILTVPLISVLFTGLRLAGLSFAPFNLFDWISRVLPGSVITFGIDSMVKIIRFLHLGAGTAEAAKTAEHIMAVFTFLIAFIIAGIVILSLLTYRKKNGFIPALISGLIIGSLLLLIDLNLHRASLINELWNYAVSVAWSLILVWSQDRLKLHASRLSPEALIEKQTGGVERVDRRRFIIRLGKVSASIVVTGAVIDLLTGKHEQSIPGSESWSAHNELPVTGTDVEPAPGTRPEYTPVGKHYRIDINATPPIIHEESWRLKISGLVEAPLELSLKQIKSYDQVNQFITLACISNPVGGDLIGTTRWTGASLQQVLPDLRLKPSAAWLKISSSDGFFETVSIDQVRNDKRIMLAYDWDGMPLTTEHGFPLRIYIPDRYGMKQPKWIESIEAMDEWEAGYWVTRGWDREAIMKATSVIDTIAADYAFTDADGKKMIPVGGIAHAGARGISKVEVKVDYGEWQGTSLRAPLSDLTWVIWRFDLPFLEGRHTLTVRCFDGAGTPQIVTPASPHPSGASGLYTKKIKG